MKLELKLIIATKTLDQAEATPPASVSLDSKPGRPNVVLMYTFSVAICHSEQAYRFALSSASQLRQVEYPSFPADALKTLASCSKMSEEEMDSTNLPPRFSDLVILFLNNTDRYSKFIDHEEI